VADLYRLRDAPPPRSDDVSGGADDVSSGADDVSGGAAMAAALERTLRLMDEIPGTAGSYWVLLGRGGASVGPRP